MIIRRYSSDDCHAMADLFYETVHHVNVKDYSQEQINAWADKNMDLVKWDRSFLDHITFVVQDQDQVVGFGDIDQEGYLDRLYVHKDYQRQKIGTCLCDHLEKSISSDTVTVHASITAKPFFEKRGYQVIKKQQVERKGILLTNYRMEKKLK